MIQAMNLLRTWAWLAFLLLLGVLRVVHVIGEAAWFVAIGVVLVVQVVHYLVRLGRHVTR